MEFPRDSNSKGKSFEKFGTQITRNRASSSGRSRKGTTKDEIILPREKEKTRATRGKKKSEAKRREARRRLVGWCAMLVGIRERYRATIYGKEKRDNVATDFEQH